MTNQLTKTDFFNKLHFLLSFRYSKSECLNILEDYNEWFEGEQSGGKSEEEICSHIGSPQKIVRQICSENPTDSKKLSILVNNAFLQFVFLVTIRMILELCVLNFCNARGHSYLYFALFINFAFFTAVMMIVKSRRMSLVKNRKNVLMDILAIFFIILNTLMMFNLSIPVGHYFAYAYEIAICIIYIIIMMQSRSIWKDCCNSYLFACKAFAVISLLFFMMNQMQMLYTDIHQCRNLLWESVVIYAETFLLTLFFHVLKRRDDV